MCCDSSTLPTMLVIPHSFLGFIKQQCLFCPPSWGPEVSVFTHLSCTYYINCFTDLVNCLGCWCWNTKAAEWLRVWRINQKWYSEWPTLLLSSTWYLTHPHPLLTPHPHPSSRLWPFSLSLEQHICFLSRFHLSLFAWWKRDISLHKSSRGLPCIEWNHRRKIPQIWLH